jgi:hypothetical protein
MNAVPVNAAPLSPSAYLPERGMRFMLSAVILFVAVTDIFDWQLSLGPGLSLKNALLYMLAGLLALKITVSGAFKLELRGLHACFAVLIVYAILSMLAAALVVDYPRYKLFPSAVNLKSRLADQAIFFLVFFYALKESRNAQAVIKVMLFAAVFANAMAVLDAWGIIQIGGLEERADGRMQGVMGESNQYAAFVCTFLPGLVAAFFCSRGTMRLVWIAGLLISTGAMIMAVSRGAFVAMFVASIWAGWLLRHRLSAQKVVGIAGAAFVVCSLAIAVLSVRYGDLLYERVFGDSGSGDMVGASSGRTEIWATAISAMLNKPVTLITGFGWDVYWTMPFRYSPHNHYVALWFNLGLVGLVCGVMLLVNVVREARLGVDRTLVPEHQATLAAFVVGALAISVATFFVDLYTPWLWFWAYAGLVMRMCVNARQAERAKPQQVVPQTTNPYGWVGRSPNIASHAGSR